LNWINFIGSGAILLAGQGLAAQDALDRTSPDQQVDRDQPLPRTDETPRIEYQPVLDIPLAPQSGSTVINVGSIVIDGLATLSRSDFAPVIEPFFGRSLDQTELRQLTDAVADLARKRGLILATARIPQQTLVGGMLRVEVDEGHIDDVRIEGSNDPAIRKQLETLIGQRPITLNALQHAVLLADDLPGVWIRATRFEGQGNARVLVVEAGREDFGGSVQISTDGTRPIGPVRARIDLNANGLISPRDRVDLSYSMTPLDPDELTFFSARYSVIINNAGTQLGLYGSYSQTEPGAYLADRELQGEAWQGGIRLRHPLLRTQQRSLWVEASGELQNLRQDSFGTLAREDRITLARLGLYGFGPLAGGTLQGRATISQGLGIFDATQLGDPLASRTDAPDDFTTLLWWLNWRRAIMPRVSLSLGASGQFSTAPLLIGESFALGGNAFLRGYDFAQRVGDQGITGSSELRYDWPNALGTVRNVQLYAFADGGTVTNLGSGVGGGTLASSGGGLRADITRDLDLDFEIALPLSEARYDTADKSPRLNLRISQSF
jgi:hemolysin activation/secretion protein